jgi:rhamnogalacturonan endolyase
MNWKTKSSIVVVLGTMLILTASTQAKRYMEKLDRGVVAVSQGSGKVYVGWRMLGTDPNDVAFNLYCSTGGGAAVKLNSMPITESTNYVDDGVNASQANSYFVQPVINGREWAASETFTLPANAPVQQYISVPLVIPAGGTCPDGGSYTYSANDCSVGDLDGDGEYEIVLKWDPSNSKDNSQSGYTGNVFLDAYELDGTLMWRIDLGINIRAGAHYTQFMVYDLDSDGRAEVACKTAPGTVDGQGNDVILLGDDPNADYRNSSGYILSGPEYLTIFDGLTGAAMATTNFLPDRVNVSQWGDNYGNRVDRFLAAIAYIDGVRPSLIMCRGYYGPQSSSGQARNEITAWNWRNRTLTQLWWFKAGYNINDNINRDYISQGNHSLSIADVDSDGKDEIIYGACAIDDDGTGLWTTGLGHGDALHVSDIDPDRPGLEVWGIHENAQVGSALLDAATGEVIWGTGAGDVGRGVAADLSAACRGMECWGGTTGLTSCKGIVVGSNPSSTNHVCWWDGDLLRELLNSNRIDKYEGSRLLTASGCSSINGTKSNPCLQADLLGDWREEVIWKTSDNSQLRIYTTTIPTNYRIYTLMHDPVYRLGIAWQNVAYNQPPHTGFYLGNGMADAPRPNIVLVGDVYGDLTGDNIVNAEDLREFSEVWLADDCGANAKLDLNGDCTINLYEFSLLAQNWLQGIE